MNTNIVESIKTKKEHKRKCKITHFYNLLSSLERPFLTAIASYAMDIIQCALQTQLALGYWDVGRRFQSAIPPQLSAGLPYCVPLEQHCWPLMGAKHLRHL